MSTKSASCAAAAQVARSARSPRSPTPHDSAERTWYSCAIRPTTRPSATAEGSERRCGVTTRVASVVSGSTAGTSRCATSRCQPTGRSPGTSKVASPTERPSTSRSGTHRSTCGTSRTVPSSSTTSSRMPVPAGTWACTHGVHPSRATTVAGRVRRHGASSTSARARSTASSPSASTPRAVSTARIAAAETVTCRPCQSQYSVATPWAWASSTSRGGGAAGSMRPSCRAAGGCLRPRPATSASDRTRAPVVPSRWRAASRARRGHRAPRPPGTPRRRGRRWDGSSRCRARR